MARPKRFTERLPLKLEPGTVAALVRIVPGQPPSVTARLAIDQWIADHAARKEPGERK